MFYVIINGTVELDWFKRSHESQPYITIDEEGLDAVLNYKEPEAYAHKVQDFTFRF